MEADWATEVRAHIGKPAYFAFPFKYKDVVIADPTGKLSGPLELGESPDLYVLFHRDAS
jgi:hypothetical protein